MQHVTLPPERLIRQPEVLRRVGISKSTLWDWIKADRFPRPVRIGERAVAWKSSEIDRWIEGRVEARAQR
jgi:prophage regulatory protein